MATTALPYTLFLKDRLTGDNPIDWLSDPIHAVLLTSTYVPDRDVHQFADDLAGECTAGAGYSTGGVVLADPVLDIDLTGHFAYVSFTSPLWSALTKTFRYLALYMSTGVASTSPLIGFVDFGEDQVWTGTDFEYTIPLAASGGLVKLGS